MKKLYVVAVAALLVWFSATDPDNAIEVVQSLVCQGSVLQETLDILPENLGPQ